MTDKITEAFEAGRALGHAEMIAKLNDKARELEGLVEFWKSKGKPYDMWRELDSAASVLACNAESLQNWSREVAGGRKDARDGQEGTRAAEDATSRAGGAFAGLAK